MGAQIFSKQIFDGTTIALSTSLESVVIHLRHAPAKEGLFSLYLYETGDGTAKAEYMLSNDGGKTYVTFTDAGDVIVSGFTKTSGPGGDGKDVIGFSPELATHMKILITETAGANAIAPVAHLQIQ